MDNDKIIELYESGQSCQEIGNYFKVSSQLVSKRLKKLGYTTRKVAGYYTPEQLQAVRDEIAELRAKDLTIKEIAGQVGLSHTSVWYHLKALDIK